MAGSQPPSPRGRRFAVALAVLTLPFASSARARTQLPPAGTPLGGAGQTAPATPPVVTPGPVIVSGPTAEPIFGMAPAAPRCELSFFDTAVESLFGDASAEGKWRPLSLGTFFSEGWNRPWASPPDYCRRCARAVYRSASWSGPRVRRRAPGRRSRRQGTGVSSCGVYGHGACNTS